MVKASYLGKNKDILGYGTYFGLRNLTLKDVEMLELVYKQVTSVFIVGENFYCRLKLFFVPNYWVILLFTILDLIAVG